MRHICRQTNYVVCHGQVLGVHYICAAYTRRIFVRKSTQRSGSIALARLDLDRIEFGLDLAAADQKIYLYVVAVLLLVVMSVKKSLCPLAVKICAMAF